MHDHDVSVAVPRPGRPDVDVGRGGGGVFAFCQIGYGIAAFRLGPLLDGGLTDLGSVTDG